MVQKPYSRQEAAEWPSISGKDLFEMKEQLREALESAAKGDLEAVRTVAERLKELPRRADGLFDTGSVDGDLFEAARWVYPVYALYETECNKKEGYPDLLNQMRALDRAYEAACNAEEKTERKTEDEVGGELAGNYLWALIHTIDNVSPQLYEYYRELADLFKRRVRETISMRYREGSFGRGDTRIRESICFAGERDILLKEKYQKYC